MLYRHLVFIALQNIMSDVHLYLTSGEKYSK